jgi:hypothetical protein
MYSGEEGFAGFRMSEEGVRRSEELLRLPDALSLETSGVLAEVFSFSVREGNDLEVWADVLRSPWKVCEVGTSATGGGAACSDVTRRLEVDVDSELVVVDG